MLTYTEIIKNHREYDGITIRQLAKKCNVSATTISDIENGKRSPSWAMHKKIKEALGLQETDLYLLRKIMKDKRQNTIEARLIDMLENEIDRLRRLI